MLNFEKVFSQIKKRVENDFLEVPLNHFFAFVLRCGQPGQQQGFRLPSFNSLTIRSICSILVSDFLTIVIQHIHSLRWIGVRLFQRVSICSLKVNTFVISSGTSCTTPFAILSVIFDTMLISLRLSTFYFLTLHQP